MAGKTGEYTDLNMVKHVILNAFSPQVLASRTFAGNELPIFSDFCNVSVADCPLPKQRRMIFLLLMYKEYKLIISSVFKITEVL